MCQGKGPQSNFSQGQGSFTSGTCQFFFKVREMSGNSVVYQGKMKFCKKKKCQGNVRKYTSAS